MAVNEMDVDEIQDLKFYLESNRKVKLNEKNLAISTERRQSSKAAEIIKVKYILDPVLIRSSLPGRPFGDTFTRPSLYASEGVCDRAVLKCQGRRLTEAPWLSDWNEAKVWLDEFDWSNGS